MADDDQGTRPDDNHPTQLPRGELEPQAPRLPEFEDVAAVITDHGTRTHIIVDRRVFANQITREAKDIEESFDQLYMDDLLAISEEAALSFSHLVVGLGQARRGGDEVGTTAGWLLFNAYTTLTAALALVRAGFRLQPGILVRVILEAIGTAIFVLMEPNKVSEVKASSFKSSQTIGPAKKVLPGLGHLYGSFSDEFVHMGEAHHSLQPLIKHAAEDSIVREVLGSIRGATWLLGVTVELAFFNTFDQPRYWQKEGEGVRFNPSDEERRRFVEFLGEDEASSLGREEEPPR